MEETRRRKEEEKRRLKMEDEELEKRVKAELAGDSDTARRHKEAQRTIAAKKLEEINEVICLIQNCMRRTVYFQTIADSISYLFAYVCRFEIRKCSRLPSGKASEGAIKSMLRMILCLFLCLHASLR